MTPTSVSFLTGVRFDYSFNARAGQDDNNFDDQFCYLTGQAYYSTLDNIPPAWYVDEGSAIESGPFNYGPVKLDFNTGGALYAPSIVPDNHVMIGIRIRHYHGVTDDDSINTQYKGAEFYIRHAPVITDGAFQVTKTGGETLLDDNQTLQQELGSAIASVTMGLYTPTGFYFENRSGGYSTDDDIGPNAWNKIGVGLYRRSGQFIIP